jgi:hypothetical protein
MWALNRSREEEGIMKKHLATLLVLGALCGVTDVAKGATDYGDLAQHPEKIAAAMKNLNAEEAQTFAAALLKAANTLPVTADVKNGLLGQVAYQLMKGCTGNASKNDMLVTIVTQATTESLTAIRAYIVAGMNANDIPPDELVAIASTVISGVEEKTKADPDALIRNTMVISIFLQVGSDLPLEQKSSLVECLVNPDMETVVKNQVNVETGEINYETLNAANGNQAVSLKPYNNEVVNESVGYTVTVVVPVIPPVIPPPPAQTYIGQVISG